MQGHRHEQQGAEAVKRELQIASLAFALAAALLVVSWAAVAQPVASVEVACKPGTQHEKLDRIERKVDLLLGRQCVAPPAPPTLPPVVVPPGPPQPPTKPAEPPPPAGPNPFIAWRAQGSTLLDYVIWRNGGADLSPAQLEQAYAAGYPRPGAPAGGLPGEPGGVNPAGFDLGAGGGTVLRHEVGAGQAVTFTFTVVAGGSPDLTVFGISGSSFRRFTDSGPGFAGRVTTPLDGRHKPLEGLALPPGTYSYTVAVEPGGSLGVQLVQ
jgi:hypothetical protein